MSSQELIATSKGRSQIMDIFRIILCIGVVVYHYTPERCSTGPLMVNGFLVMSGFLVGFSIFSTKGLNVHYFFNSKCRRLLPMFLMALLFGIVAHVLNGAYLPTWTAQKWGNFDIISFISFYNIPLWYMAVECTMLLLVPFFAFLASARWRLEICTLLLTLASLLLFSRVPENARKHSTKSLVDAMLKA